MIDIYVCKMTKLFGLWGGGRRGTQILFLVPFLFHFFTVILPKIIHRIAISSTLYLVNETKYQYTVVIYQAFIFISSNLVSKY